MAEGLTIQLNGAERHFTELGPTATVSDLVQALGFRADRVALERNGEIVPRTGWPGTVIASGDRVELVHFVGGGTQSALQLSEQL